MKSGWYGAILLALALPGVQAQAPPKRSDVPLAPREFTTGRDLLELTGGGIERPLGPGKGPRGSREWVAPGHAAFRLQLGGRPKPIRGIVGKAPGRAAYERLWLDWNGDLRPGAEERYEGTESNGLVRFGPFQRGALAPFEVVVHENKHVHVIPSGYREGEVELAGRKVRVGLVDANASGVYGDPGTFGGGGDLLLVDFNGDGRFTGVSQQTITQPWDLEALPASRLVGMPDGRYYQVTTSADGSSLTLEPDPSPAGRVKLPFPRFAMQVRSAAGPLWARGTEGSVPLPAGSYDVDWITLGAPEEGNRLWSVSMIPPAGGASAERLNVAATGETELACGPPFRLTLQARARGRARDFLVGLRDRSGNLVSDVVRPEGGSPPPPELRILTPAGKVVHLQKLRYRREFACAGSWTAPKGLNGPLEIEVAWPLGPWQVEPVRKTLAVGAEGRLSRR